MKIVPKPPDEYYQLARKIQKLDRFEMSQALRHLHQTTIAQVAATAAQIVMTSPVTERSELAGLIYELMPESLRPKPEEKPLVTLG